MADGVKGEIPEIPEAERERLRSALLRMMELGVGAVYGVEDEGVPEKRVDCGPELARCRARCCTLSFALTKEEAREGRIRHDPKRPFFIRREADGYCSHLERESLRCGAWDERPLRCRRYDCRDEAGGEA
jgi:Fe-S-cluster containining protein